MAESGDPREPGEQEPSRSGEDETPEAADRAARSSIEEQVKAAERAARLPGEEFLNAAVRAARSSIEEQVKTAERAARLPGEEFLNAADRAARSSTEEQVKASERALRGLAGLGISDDLKKSFGRTAELTSSLDSALAQLRGSSAPDSYRAPELMSSLPDPAHLVPPNPIHETNKQLAELSQTTRNLVGIAQTQAELSQSLAETSALVLKETIRSGKQAKIATGIAAAGIIMTFIISAATMYYNYQQRQAEAEHSQREIQVLRESSRESRAAADSHSQDEMRALSDILRALQNPNTTAPNNPRPKPKALFGKE